MNSPSGFVQCDAFEDFSWGEKAHQHDVRRCYLQAGHDGPHLAATPHGGTYQWPRE